MCTSSFCWPIWASPLNLISNIYFAQTQIFGELTFKIFYSRLCSMHWLTHFDRQMHTYSYRAKGGAHHLSSNVSFHTELLDQLFLGLNVRHAWLRAGARAASQSMSCLQSKSATRALNSWAACETSATDERSELLRWSREKCTFAKSAPTRKASGVAFEALGI